MLRGEFYQRVLQFFYSFSLKENIFNFVFKDLRKELFKFLLIKIGLYLRRILSNDLVIVNFDIWNLQF